MTEPIESPPVGPGEGDHEREDPTPPDVAVDAPVASAEGVATATDAAAGSGDEETGTVTGDEAPVPSDTAASVDEETGTAPGEEAAAPSDAGAETGAGEPPGPSAGPRPSGPPIAAKPGALRPGRQSRPGSPPRVRSGGPGEGKPVPRPPRPGVTPPPVHDAQDAAEAAQWGRVDADGTVWVREAESERAVGQYPGADAKEALAYYVVRFLDLQAQVALLEARLAQLAVKEIDQTLASLEAALQEPAAVGDLAALRERLSRVAEAARERRAEAAAEREAARKEALAARTAIVEEAEQIVQGDPARIQWRQAGERLRALLDDWKEAQRLGPRLDKTSEDRLWKRFSQARATFDRGRRQFFAEQEQRRTEARAVKEELIETAERLATSTDWSATAAAYRGLMDRWKAAGRTAPREDDALWERFRAAQDAFFAARNAAGAASEAEYAENLRAKEALLEEAEALLPVRDLNRARSALRSIQDRWEAIGKVPRGDVQRVEGRLRAVEQSVRDSQQQVWNRKNPETKARAEGALAALEASIAGLEADLQSAQEQGDARAVKAAREALAARQAWLAQIRRTAEEVR